MCFGNQDTNKSLISKLLPTQAVSVDSGIEGLAKIANSGRITPEMVPNYTHIVYKGRLEVVYGYRNLEEKSTKEEYLKISEAYKNIILNADRYYDMVLVDLDKQLDNAKTKELLNISDVVVYNIEQKISMINEFLKLKKEMGIKKKDNIVLNIGRFDADSKYTIKNISRYMGMSKDLTVIPYNTLYFEAAGEEKVADLFLKIRKISETDKNSEFVKQVKQTVEKIIYKLQEVQMKI